MSMTSAIHCSVSNPLVKRLIDIGVIPAQCRTWTLKAEVNSVLTITSEIIVSEEMFEKIVKAIEDHPEEAAQMRTILEIVEIGEKHRRQTVGAFGHGKAT